MVHITQPSFAGGELKPSLHGRVDIGKYGVGCKVLKNWIIHAGGGISNRGGQRYICKAKFSDKNAILVPFQYSTEQTYFLEFGDLYMRVYKNGGLVLNTAKNITGITNANPAVFTSNAHGYTVGTWVYIAGVGGMREVNGRFYIVSAVTTNTFTLTDLFGNVINSTDFTAYTAGGTVSSVYELTTPYAHTDLVSAYENETSQEKIGIVFTQSANVMTITHTGYQQRELTRSGHAAWTLTPISFAPAIAAPTGLAMTGSGSTGGTSTIKYIVTAVDANTGEESVASASVSSTACKNPNSWVAADVIDLTWTAVAGASKYNVYKDKNGFYGFIGPATNNSFRDDNIEPVANDSFPEQKNPFSGAGNYAGAVTLHDQRVVYARTINDPDTVFMTQTSNYKNMNVSVPSKATDGVQFTISSEQVNAIKYLLSINDLIAFTGNAEWKLAGSGDTAISPTTVSAFKQSGRGIAPVPPLLVGNTALFVQARGKKIRDFKYTIEADGYDGNDISILSSHLFRKTRNVDKRVKCWSYQQEPDSIVWIVHNDGSLSSLTYQREHEVWGFARHETDGKYKAVCAIPEGDNDNVYFIVEREINGVKHQFIEGLETRDSDEDDILGAFFVDSGVQYFDNTFLDFYGLEHLEGKTVTILADGNVLPNEVVQNGKITLDDVYETVAIGLPYSSDVQPMDIETDTQVYGSTKGKMKRIPRVFLHCYNSRGIKAGPNFESLKEYTRERTNELMGEATRLQTGVIDVSIKAEWKSRAAVCLRHDYPLPFTLLTVTPDVELST